MLPSKAIAGRVDHATGGHGSKRGQHQPPQRQRSAARTGSVSGVEPPSALQSLMALPGFSSRHMGAAHSVAPSTGAHDEAITGSVHTAWTSIGASGCVTRGCEGCCRSLGHALQCCECAATPIRSIAPFGSGRSWRWNRDPSVSSVDAERMTRLDEHLQSQNQVRPPPPAIRWCCVGARRAHIRCCIVRPQPGHCCPDNPDGVHATSRHGDACQAASAGDCRAAVVQQHCPTRRDPWCSDHANGSLACRAVTLFPSCDTRRARLRPQFAVAAVPRLRRTGHTDWTAALLST